MTVGDCTSFDVGGEAQILITAPFFPDVDPLGERTLFSVSDHVVAAESGDFTKSTRSLDPLLKGTLTYGNPQFEQVLLVNGSAALVDRLLDAVEWGGLARPAMQVGGMLFEDGVGAVSLRLRIPGGWTSARTEFVARFGPAGREEAADALRTVLLGPLAALLRAAHPGDGGVDLRLPYFNLTYVAETTEPYPGRGVLPDELRMLLYPRYPQQLRSDSPWADEFFYAGYAYNFLASPAPDATLDQLELLLPHLDVQYSRMDSTAAAADRAIRDDAHAADVSFLTRVERQLRADYQALVRPTFSFDYHVLKLRDSLLLAWETDKTRARTDTLLQMARQGVERRMADAQAKRIGRINLVVAILTILSILATVDAALSILERL